MPILSFAGQSLPLPDNDGVSVATGTVGTSERMLDVTLRSDIRATPTTIALRWSLLSKADKDALCSVWGGALTTADILVLPNGSVYTVQASVKELGITEIFDIRNVPYYNVTAEFQEV